MTLANDLITDDDKELELDKEDDGEKDDEGDDSDITELD